MSLTAESFELPVLSIDCSLDAVIDPMETEVAGRLEALLPDYLCRQRWFGHKIKKIESVRFEDIFTLAETPVPFCLSIINVDLSERSYLYLLPLTFASGQAAYTLLQKYAEAGLAWFNHGGESTLLFDASVNPLFWTALAEWWVGQKNGKSSSGSWLPSRNSEIPYTSFHSAAPVTGEQSNSSAIVDDIFYVKLYRRLANGLHPESELLEYLTSSGFDHVPSFLGRITYNQEDRFYTAAIIQEAITSNVDGDGWSYALKGMESAYTCIVEKSGMDLDEIPSEMELMEDDVGSMARKIGTLTADMHISLSEATRSGLRPETVSQVDIRRRYERVRANAKYVRQLLKSHSDRYNILPTPEQWNRALQRIDKIQALAKESTYIRIHGDYHLGQILRCRDDYFILDFEGEPAHSLRQRRQHDSALKDVAGMLRSLEYVTLAGCLKHGVANSELLELTHRIVEYCETLFLDAYYKRADQRDFLPQLAVRRLHLWIFLFDKALYEVQYELNHRPDWTWLPLIGLRRLLDNHTPSTRTQTPGASMSWLSKNDLQRWENGAFSDSYRKLGAHANAQGTWFTVWAPHADAISVLGEFNDWQADAHHLRRTRVGLWQVYVRGAKPGHHYKFRLRRGLYSADKTDPFAFAMEPPTEYGSASSGLASIITDLSFDWKDDEWMENRKGPESLNKPVAIYEVHLGSWNKKHDGYSLNYREIAEPLADHVEKLGFSHVEFLPLMEHPYYGSWGYQVVGYYAPTYRFGSPYDLMYLVDYLHQRGIGVIFDWVPAHFATDPQGLVFFDGSTLFEYDDPQMRFHPDWGTYVFDYNKPGVRNFLVSNALFWLREYHVDGLRFDAVASMIYRDYSREHHWSPNIFGGRENLEAISLLKQINETVYTEFPEILMIAEESTAWPGVSQPTYNNGLGFLFKWNMGWMHDTLEYVSKEPVHRKYHHDNLTFPLVYAFSEHYTLPLSHDEVVHGKGSLWSKMPGDPWQKAANLRILYGHMIGHPGKKLLFMGSEFGQENEWDHDHALQWHLLDDPLHSGLMQWVRDLFALYKEHPALWNDDPGCFEWLDFGDRENSVICYLRKNGDRSLLFLLNFTPVFRSNYRVGVPRDGLWKEVLNSDSKIYGGGDIGNFGEVEATPVPYQGRSASIIVTLPPLGLLILERVEAGSEP